jgi:predicted secreted Zn-dependent protease
MKFVTRTLVAAAIVFAALPARAWQAAEKVEPYRIEGATGLALYRSIGERGPKAGAGRAIAFTDFKLLWSRDYQQRADGSCVLASARPSLTINYRLPQPAGQLPPETKARWERFIEGIRAHERVHGELIIDMVKKIEAFSTGLTAASDPGCKKVRATLQKRLGELSQEQRAASRDFDRDELTQGGNVHQLVLGLVN